MDSGSQGCILHLLLMAAELGVEHRILQTDSHLAVRQAIALGCFLPQILPLAAPCLKRTKMLLCN